MATRMPIAIASGIDTTERNTVMPAAANSVVPLADNDFAERTLRRRGDLAGVAQGQHLRLARHVPAVVESRAGVPSRIMLPKASLSAACSRGSSLLTSAT